MKNYDHFIGLTVEDAQKQYSGYIRVRVKDGQGLMGTCDWVANRLNVETKDGKIVKIKGLG